MKGAGNFVFTKDDNIKAVYSSDLENFLEKLGISDAFKQGSVTCRYCGTVISENNLYAIIPVNRAIEFCCSQPECILSLAGEAEK